MRMLASDAQIYLHIHSDDIDGQTLESLARSLEELIQVIVAILTLLQSALDAIGVLLNMPVDMVRITLFLAQRAEWFFAIWLARALLGRVKFRLVA